MSKVIIVTGASRGIGLAVSNYLLQKQCNIVVIARTQTLQQLETSNADSVKFIAKDLSDHSVGPEAVKLALSSWGRLDGVVINHGVLSPVTTIADSSAEDWRHAFDINLFSAVSLIQAAIEPLRKTQGRIVLVSSGAATSAYQGWGAYGASKAAMNHLATTLALEERAIATIALRPGVVDTEMQREIREQHQSIMDQQVAARFVKLKSDGELLKPEKPGNVIARLVLEAPIELSGRFISWNDGDLAYFQD